MNNLSRTILSQDRWSGLNVESIVSTIWGHCCNKTSLGLHPRAYGVVVGVATFNGIYISIQVYGWNLYNRESFESHCRMLSSTTTKTLCGHDESCTTTSSSRKTILLFLVSFHHNLSSRGCQTDHDGWKGRRRRRRRWLLRTMTHISEYIICLLVHTMD